MSTRPSDSEGLDEVTRLYAAYLESRSGDGEAEFEAFCTAYPEHAEALRELRRDLACVGDDLEPGDSGRHPAGRYLQRVSRLGGRERYRQIDEVARGGMGAIVRVWDEHLQRELAMKVALGQSGIAAGGESEDDQILARFLEEAQVTGQLNHPGIVPVHDLGLDDEGRAFFTMRLVKGRNLHDVFELVRTGQEGWSQTRALSVLLRVCEAMSYAHNKGVIHRDLKPHNVMVGRFGEVYVMDWGLARVLGREDPRDLRLRRPDSTARLRTLRTEAESGQVPDSPLVTMDGAVVGTPAYMPLEQAAGELECVDRRSDVYAIGAMLYQLLTGHMPYVPEGKRPSPHTVLAAVLQGPPTPVVQITPDVPPELEAICAKAMSRERDARYADTLEVAEDLRAYLEGRVVRAYEAGAWAEARKWVQRNRPLAASLAAVLLVALVSLAVVFRLQGRAAERGREVFRLSAMRELDELRERARTLWPAHPPWIPAYEEWLADAAELRAALAPHPKRGDPGHRRRLAELRDRALPPLPGEESPRVWRFADERDSWWHDQLTGLIAGLEALADPETGLIRGKSPEFDWGIARRLEFARTVRELTVDRPEARRRWSEARAAVAAHPLYGGLELEPQLGLLPLGPDPSSTLWEFWHLQTGDEPLRDAAGRIVSTETSGLVFVLLPGGRFWMGAQREDPRGRNYDPEAEPNEGPLCEVEVAPFFLSKFEMTQGQWMRFTGHNPSLYLPADYRPEWNAHSIPADLRHPVENVRWIDCHDVTQRLGLSLPSEVQWEYAARAGTSTPWFVGEDPALLGSAANLADAWADAHTKTWVCEPWDDGYKFHAPVGSYQANAFGIHDAIGNVVEWCLDGYREDPYVDPATVGRRVARGGDFKAVASLARVSERGHDKPEYRSNSVGFRPCRPLSGTPQDDMP